VHVRAWQWAYRGLLPDAMLDGMSIDARTKVWVDIIGNPALELPLVAIADGEVVGFVHQGASRDEDAGPEVGEVTAIYIDEARVGLGVGRGLWNAALDLLRERGLTTITVWVLDTNVRGRAFYERMGFELDGGAKSEDRGTFTTNELRYRGSLEPA